MIKIISGTYGLKIGDRIVPKNSKSKPFSVPKAEEKRLVSLGIAEIVENVQPVEDPGFNQQDGAIDGLESMTVKELKVYAEEKDIEIPKSAKTKNQIIDVISSADNSANEQENEADEPQFNANLPE